MSDLSVILDKLETIDDRLETIDGKLDSLVEWKAIHITQHETVGRDLTEVRMEMFGNPSEEHSGLKSKVQTLLNCKEVINKWKSFWMYVLQALIISGILGIVVWLLKGYSIPPIQ